jgi:Large eukaryotic DNA virus major capsid protein/Major capsid protein N-terminus
VSCTVSRNGDLINRVYLQVDLPALAGTACAWTRNIGHVMIDYVNIEIGGQEIDRHYGDWLNIWNELTQTAEKEDGYNVMIGSTVDLTDVTVTPNSTPAATLYVPLQFWFCRNPGLALPLIALQYHEVKFNISFRPVSECTVGTVTGTPSISNASLYIDYVYLDTDERRQFAQVQHEYLIEQLQFTGAESYSNSAVKSKLALNHPCKELVWVIQPDANVTAGANRWADYTDGTTDYLGGDCLGTAKLQLNGQDRFSVRDATYFNVVQPYQHHTRCPATGIYVYSFSLNPEQHQPSGTVNMSRIDNATLLLDLTTATDPVQLRVYAVNYNVLRIMAGMGGLAFAS